MVSETLQGIEGKMQASVRVSREDLATIRTGHATPALVEHIKVEYAGVPTPLNQLLVFRHLKPDCSLSSPGTRAAWAILRRLY